MTHPWETWSQWAQTAGILPSCNKVGKLLKAAKLAQHQGCFSDLASALAWAKQWTKEN